MELCVLVVVRQWRSRASRTEAGDLTIGPMVAATFWWLVVFVAIAVALSFGVVWGLVPVLVVAALTGGVYLWDRWTTAPPALDPAAVDERNRPPTPALLAAALGDYLTEIMEGPYLGDADRCGLVDLEQRLRRQAEGRHLEEVVEGMPHEAYDGWELVPYGLGWGVECDLAVVIADVLLDGDYGGGQIPGWSPPEPADAAALTWFLENFPRIVRADEENFQRARRAPRRWRSDAVRPGAAMRQRS
jgi:hypothetical protein